MANDACFADLSKSCRFLPCFRALARAYSEHGRMMLRIWPAADVLGPPNNPTADETLHEPEH